MSAKPIEFACTRPRSIKRSLTHRSRRRSVARATAGVPAGPMRDCASRRSRLRISGRLESSSTGMRRVVRTAAPRPRSQQARRAHQVGLRGKIGWVVELDGGGRVDDDVAGADELAALIAETEPIASEVELEHP